MMMTILYFAAVLGPMLSQQNLPDSKQADPLSLVIGSTTNDYGKDVSIDKDGNILLAGYFGGTCDLDPGEGTQIVTAGGVIDTVLAKFTPAGRLIWARQIGGPGADMPHTVLADAKGDIFLTGYFMARAKFDPNEATSVKTSNGKRDLYLAKYGADGSLRWVVTIGGPEDDEGMDLAIDPQGNVVLTGVVHGPVSLDQTHAEVKTSAASGGDEDLLIAKYSSSGNLIWGRAIGGPQADQGHAVAVAADGDLRLTGFFTGPVEVVAASDGRPALSFAPVGSRDTFAMRLSSEGKAKWITTLGSAQDDFSAPGGICTRPDGSTLWTGRLRGPTRFGGSTPRPNGADDCFVAEVDGDGKPKLAFCFGGRGGDGGHRVELDPNGNTLVGGWFTGAADFEPGGEEKTMTAQGLNGVPDAFVAKFSPTGSLVWSTGFGGPLAQRGQGRVPDGGIAAGLTVDGQGRVLITGRFYQTAKSYGSATGLVRTSAGGSDLFLLRLNGDGR
jgi:hypothetical protein